MKVSRAAYYAHRTAGPSAHARQDAELTEQIAAIHDESNGTYGTPRLHAKLRHRGRRHSRKRIAGSCAPPDAPDGLRNDGAPPPSPTRPRALQPI
ncbi:IS3 family transposase [Amycolatopsis methanolica]|uniref:IS3 family transposase n=1 Tax=Amycolatopsis methanolica TaxID=1814 RepID=UPI003420022A